jgi:uncharacterized protein
VQIPRRKLLTAGGAIALAALPLPVLFRRRPPPAGLLADPEGILDLPAGFSYRVLERQGERMSDGYRVPGMPDGMACFAGPAGTWILMRNHEVGRFFGAGAYSEGQPAPAEAFDPTAFGGVTRLVVDATRLERLSSNLVLTGTLRNCAGGTSPWGWLSCEETSEAGHGYVFLCRTDADQVARAERLPAYGRFNHEAAAVDPDTLIAYLSEDREDGYLYRFVPAAPERPFEGRLEALKLSGESGFDTGRALGPGRRLPVEWVPIDHPDPPEDSVRLQARERGAARVRRGEGLWQFGRQIYVAATSGGRARKGQILRLALGDSGAPDTLESIVEGSGEDDLDGPDNLTVAPWGDLYLAEDGAGEQFVRGVTPEGALFTVARNAASRSEITGVCFSPDGRALFLNLQRDGLTLAVVGPFGELRKRAG